MILVPHLEKVRIADLPLFGADVLDPPLTEKAKAEVSPLTERLLEHGKPGLILCSPRLRCRQTAAEAIRRFGGYHGEGIPVVELSDLALADNSEWCKRETAPANYPAPARRKEGDCTYHIWGPETDETDWLASVRISGPAIQALCDTELLFEVWPMTGPVWVFTHGPIVAAWKWAYSHPEWPDEQPPHGGIILRDPALRPFLILDG